MISQSLTRSRGDRIFTKHVCQKVDYILVCSTSLFSQWFLIKMEQITGCSRATMSGRFQT